MGWLSNLFKKKNNESSVKKTEPQSPPKQDPIIIKDQANVPLPKKKWDLLFVDLSHFEKDFAPEKYTAPLFLNKCTQGVSMIDGTHQPRKEICNKNNIIYGGYHFWEAKQDPIEQAKFYLKILGDVKFPAIVDFETYEIKKNGIVVKKQTTDDLRNSIPNLKIFLDYVEKQTGMTPIFYSYTGMLNELKLDSSFKKYPLWIARYNTTLGSVPLPWSEFTFWQYTDDEFDKPAYRSYFDGIGRCDCNIYNEKTKYLEQFNIFIKD